mgnify:CR=1 FL=1
MEILVKNGNFGQKWKFWSKMENLVKNGTFADFSPKTGSVKKSLFRCAKNAICSYWRLKAHYLKLKR